MTRGKKLVLLFAVFIILAALAVIITKIGYNSEDSLDSSFDLNLINTDNLTEISWSYGGISYDLKKKESGWANGNDETVDVNSTYLNEIFEKVDGISATKVIEGDEALDLSQFGLDSPECKITLTSDNETQELLFGAENEIGGMRYFSIGDGKIYLVDSGILTSFECEEGDLFKLDEENKTSDDKSDTQNEDSVTENETEEK